MDSQRRFKNLICESNRIEGQKKAADVLASFSLVMFLICLFILFVSLAMPPVEQQAGSWDKVTHAMIAIACGFVAALFAVLFAKAEKNVRDCGPKLIKLAQEIETAAASFWDLKMGSKSQASGEPQAKP